MKELGGFLALLILGAIVAMIALSELNESITEKNNSQAAVINAQVGLVAAQGESRLNASQAALPFAVMGVGLAVGGAIVVVALVVLSRPAPAQPPAPLLPARVIERQIIWVVPEGVSRRELWQGVSASSKVMAQIEER